MNEYTKLLAKNGIRFTGSPVSLSPQLEDYGIQNVLHPLAIERNAKFRAVLYVPSLEQNELRIVFPTEGTMEVHMEHGPRKMPKKQQVSWSRDCRYFFKLPEGVSGNCLTAIWTHDSFLVIQSRGSRPFAESGDKDEVVDQIIPSKVCAILRPHLDLSIIKDMMLLHQTEVEEICNYLETRGAVPDNLDVFGMLKSFPGKLKKDKEHRKSGDLDEQTEAQGSDEATKSPQGKDPDEVTKCPVDKGSEELMEAKISEAKEESMET